MTAVDVAWIAVLVLAYWVLGFVTCQALLWLVHRGIWKAEVTDDTLVLTHLGWPLVVLIVSIGGLWWMARSIVHGTVVFFHWYSVALAASHRRIHDNWFK